MLNNFRISYASTVLLALAALLFANAAQAMKIRQFDKMAIPDQGGYIGLLVGGAEKVLKDAAQMEDAAKVEHLFTTILPGDQHALGSVEFERNLARARAVDADRVLKEPNARRLEVEDAMFVTLKKNGIILPHSFFTVMQDFKPKHPPRAMEIREFDKMVVADQADYIQLLVDIAQKVLVHERNQDLAAKVHRLDLAAKVHRLFTEIPPGDKKSLGVAKFEGTLAQLRVAPEAEWVEDAMELTLSVNGIEVPYGSLTVDKDFKPKHPPKEKGK